MAEENTSDVLINPETASSEAVASTKPKLTGTKSNEKYGYYWGTGRRKSSVARVRIRPGQGKFLVNKRELKDYFVRIQDQQAILAPLKTIDSEKRFDVFVNVKGGGTTGQSGAVSLGVARALKSFDESLVGPLRDAGHLTRDARMTERKKYGQRGARRRFQFSKR